MQIANRWTALVIIMLTVAQFSLNWFDITSAFKPLSIEMGLSFSSIGLLIGVFLVGYGVLHIPAGLITRRWGMQAGLLIGVVTQLAGVLMSAAAPSYGWLLAGRVLCGAGGSVCIGAATGLVGVWFAGREVGFATAMVTGVAFTLGAVAGIYGWIPVTAALGWRAALFAGGALALLAIVMLVTVRLAPRETVGEHATGGHAELRGPWAVLRNRNIWLWGLANFGAYGAYGAAAQLLPGYAERSLGATPQQAGFISLLLLVSGLPAALLAGFYLDLRLPPRLYFLASTAICGVCFIAVPHLPVAPLCVVAGVLGFVLIAVNAFWFSIPAFYPDEICLEDIPAAIGLMLTFGAISGFATPVVFTKVAETSGFTAAWTLIGIGVAACGLLCTATTRIARTPARNRDPIADAQTPASATML